MANNNTPFGFRPYNPIGGGVNGRLGSYIIASALASNVFNGDCVGMVGTGRRITIATVATGAILGSFHGVRYTDSLGEIKFMPFWPTGTVATGLVPGADGPEALVHDDPMQSFIAQVNGVGLAAADEFSTMDFVAGAGSTLTGQSAHQLDASSVAASQQFIVLGLAPLPGMEYGVSAKAFCQNRVPVLSNSFAGV